MSCRPATFAVAVTSSSATAASRIRIAGLTSAVNASSIGTAVTSAGPWLPKTAIAVTPCSGAARARAVPSAAACCGVAPGRRRPMAWNIEIENPTLPGVTTGGTLNGTHARVLRSGNAKAAGITPMTV